MVNGKKTIFPLFSDRSEQTKRRVRMISRHQVHAVFLHTFFFFFHFCKSASGTFLYTFTLLVALLCSCSFFFFRCFLVAFFFLSLVDIKDVSHYTTSSPPKREREREKKKEESLVVSQGGLSWRVVTRESYVQAAPRTHIDSSNRNNSKSSAP